jgi:hypothetical protein
MLRKRTQQKYSLANLFGQNKGIVHDLLKWVRGGNVVVAVGSIQDLVFFISNDRGGQVVEAAHIRDFPCLRVLRRKKFREFNDFAFLLEKRVFTSMT